MEEDHRETRSTQGWAPSGLCASLPKVTADGNELQGYTRPGAKSKDSVRKKQLNPTLGWSGPPYYMHDTVQALGQHQRSKGHRQGRKYHAHRNMLASVG